MDAGCREQRPSGDIVIRQVPSHTNRETVGNQLEYVVGRVEPQACAAENMVGISNRKDQIRSSRRSVSRIRPSRSQAVFENPTRTSGPRIIAASSGKTRKFS